jgi:hypothetical protein
MIGSSDVDVMRRRVVVGGLTSSMLRAASGCRAASARAYKLSDSCTAHNTPQYGFCLCLPSGGY